MTKEHIDGPRRHALYDPWPEWEAGRVLYHRKKTSMTPKDKNLQAITENAEQLARELETARRERDCARAQRDSVSAEEQAIRKAYGELHAKLETARKERDVAEKERDGYKAQLETVFIAVATRAGVSTSLAAVGKRAHENCFKRGFHKPGAMRSYLKRTAHACEELMEALHCIDRDCSSYYVREGKPEGVLAEFADAIILISEMAYHYLAANDSHLCHQGVSLDSAVAAKLEYNDSRKDGVNGNSV